MAFVAACAVAGWQIVAGGAAAAPMAVLRALLWPGLAVFFAVYLFAWLGWALDLG